MSEVAIINPAIGKHGRHKWGEAKRFPYKTEVSCERCQIVKVTRHEPSVRPWLEFYRDGERVNCERTPVCESAEVPFA
ncbi:MAG: hypothetical protein Q8M26_08805 [Pseudolabrys sp.]|nr:hypothetical protein [Pseudolabrys sp.]